MSKSSDQVRRRIIGSICGKSIERLIEADVALKFVHDEIRVDMREGLMRVALDTLKLARGHMRASELRSPVMKDMSALRTAVDLARQELNANMPAGAAAIKTIAARDEIEIAIRGMRENLRRSEANPVDTHEMRTPPRIRAADLLLSRLLSPADYEAVLGDLEEAYRKRLSRMRKPDADRWYKQQLFGTFLSFLWDACRRWAPPGRRKEQL